MSRRHCNFGSIPQWLVSGYVAAVCFAAWSPPALAYRPFDGTDAAVARDCLPALFLRVDCA